MRTLALAVISLAMQDEKKFTDTFPVAADEWSSTGSNPYFVLEEGHTLTLEGGKGVLTVTVLGETKKVDGVETRIVEERETEGGELKEVSRNYFAISRKTSSVYYFGEDVDIYERGTVVGHDGSWLSGEKGARFGLMMPGTPLLGARYYQEIAPRVAMDRAEIVSLEEKFDGKFERCLKIEESSPLEKGKQYKLYAPGVGLVQDGELKLTRVTRARK